MSMSSVGALGAYRTLDQFAAAKDANAAPDAAAKAFTEIFDKADAAVQGFATGHVNAQGVVEAISQAEMALQTAVTIRDRVVTAYQELLRMPL